jgi:DNA-binding transcriptional LysR family regulator
MEIKQLEVFAAVAKNLSFSKAAEELFISQSTVSSHISSLEKTLGVQLLIRNTKGVSLSKAGVGFLTYTQKILSLKEQALMSVNAANYEGSIDIVSSTIPAQHLLPEIIAAFKRKWSKITIYVEQMDSRQVEKAMTDFRYDFGFVGAAPYDDRFIHYPIYDDELVLVVPNDTQESSDVICSNFPEFITKAPFITREKGSGTRAEIEALLSKIGVDAGKLQIPASFSDAHGVLSAVSNGMGVSLVSKVAATIYAKAKMIRLIEMNSPLFHRKIYILHNKEFWLTPIQQTFADFARQFYFEYCPGK